MRTGEIINIILDEVGWPEDQRDIDFGASWLRWWWAEDTDAFSALQEIVRGEGPPAIAYVSPDGTFVFRDRHHRLLRTRSLESQATFASFRTDDCPPVTGSPVTGAPPITGTTLDYTPPFEYQHGWRDIFNVVQEDVSERNPDSLLSEVWSVDTPFSILIGQTVEIRAVGNNPFIDAVTPVEGVDFEKVGVGSVSVVLLRDSGQATTIRMTSVGGDVTILNLKLRARSIPSTRTVQVFETEPQSISLHGTKTYPDSIPLVTDNDVRAVAEVILAHYSSRRPVVRMRVVDCDPDHLVQIYTRTISDNIRIINAEMGMDAQFFIERLDHVVSRIDPQKPPIHSVVLGCERALDTPNNNPFTFDKVGAGFDDGFFDPLAADDPSTIWIWNVQNTFDVNKLAT